MPAAPQPPAPTPIQALRDQLQRARARLRQALVAKVCAALADRDHLGQGLAAQARATAGGRHALALHHAALQRDILALDRRLSFAFGSFIPTMTVDAAWSRHPRAREAFVRRSLPACDRCAVRFDETLEEAASAYGFDLAQLLDELNALLNAPRRTPQPR